MAEVYRQLHADVVSGDLDSGEPLVETTLARRYGVSRTPIRDALNRLEQDGLIERRHRSLMIRTRTPSEILEIYQVRVTLEGLAAAEATQHRTELDLRRIRAAHEIMLDLRPGDGTDATRLARVNRDFHEAVWAAAHNATLLDLLHRLHDHLRRYPETTLTAAGRWEQVLLDHDELTGLIEARDESAAQELAQRHMRAARDIRLTLFARDV